MLSRVIGDAIELRLALGQDVGCVLADRTQLEQIVMNLVVNARDAMPRGGLITVETDRTYIDSQTSASLDLSSGNYVRITVKDTGVGMDLNVSSHVFDPFFSTKKESGGSGLGLAIVQGIVTQLKGHIDVESSTGKGAQFRVLLPWSAGQAEEATISNGHIQGGDETILIIEDAEELCAMMGFVLRGFGYTVLTASDGQQGVEVARKHPGKIHLLLTDIAMPRLGGPEAAEQIRRERPDIKIIMMTGFAGHELLGGKTVKNARVLEKPVTPAALARAVRDALGQAA
jgi:CheY-like chemotaxis protein